MPGWVEESFTNFERNINWRSFVVCDVAFNSVNNWLWTPFIERGEASRLYIEIKFTMRDCNLFPQQVRSCKETFALLYKEMDVPIEETNDFRLGASNASFAQSDSYNIIGAIAADDGRFTSNTDVVINTEIRSVPVSKRGVYFAFRDQGACLSLISIKVYHIRCPQLTTNFAHFNATPTGKDLISLVAVEGKCVPNSLQIEQPKMFCTADGNWNTMSSGQCKCMAGFEPAANQTKCQACPPGRYKSALGDTSCLFCPERSSAPYAGASECKCHEGYYRAAKDPRSAPCTQPPSGPLNLSATYVDSTSVVLQWQAPKFTGGRDDLTYKLHCDNCDHILVSSPPHYTNFSETKCVLSGLSPSTTYRFLVYAFNGVSHLASQQQQMAPQFSEISLQTNRPTAQTMANTLSSQGNLQLLPIYNFRALTGARGTDMLLAWDAQPLPGASSAALASDTATPLILGQLPAESSSAGALTDPSQMQFPSLYEIRYQPRAFVGGHADAYTQRRSPYPVSLVGGPNLYEAPQPSGTAGHHHNPQAGQQYQSITTTNRALSIQMLQPRTEYAFQIRAKWPSSSQWTDFSEPIYMSTGNQLTAPASPAHLAPTQLLAGELDFQPDHPLAGRPQPLPSPFPPMQANLPLAQQQSASWLSTLLLVLLCALISLAFVSVTLIHYRKSLCLRSLGAGFGHLGGAGAGAGGSSYAGVYGSGASSDLMGVNSLAFGSSPLANGTSSIVVANGHNHRTHLHHATLSAGSAGGLITGSNATSRSSSSGGGGGAGNVVQNFLAATLSQLSGGHHHSNHHANNAHSKNHSNQNALTLGGQSNESKLFAPMTNQIQQRNHYHQTLTSTINHNSNSNNNGNNNNSNATLLSNPQNNFQLAAHHHHQLTLATQLANHHHQQQQANDLFSYRTFGQPGAHYGQLQQQPPQYQQPDMHIYDDLDSTCAIGANQQQQQQQVRQQQHSPSETIDPQRVNTERHADLSQVDVNNWIRSATYESAYGR